MNQDSLVNFCYMLSLQIYLCICLRPAYLFFLVDSLARERMMTTLDQEVSTLRAFTFAESTRRTYQCQQSLYLRFCAGLNIPPVPIFSSNLGRYIAYLGQKLSYSSVRQYLNVVRIMHLDEGHCNPLANNWYLNSILKKVEETQGRWSQPGAAHN